MNRDLFERVRNIMAKNDVVELAPPRRPLGKRPKNSDPLFKYLTGETKQNQKNNNPNDSSIIAQYRNMSQSRGDAK